MSRTADVGDDGMEAISSELYDIHGIRFGKFTLTSGKTSPYYVDLRLIPSYPELFEEIIDICVETVEDKIGEIDRVVGVPTGGLPLAALVSQKLTLPMLYARKDAKFHGRKKSIEGVLKEGDEVLIVDDVATTGGSVADTVETIRAEGGSVESSLVVLDREEEATQKLADKGVQLYSCFEISDIVDSLEERGLLDDKKYYLVKEYIEGQSD